MNIKGLSKSRFVRAAAASALALMSSACATRFTNENGMVTNNLDLGIIRTTETRFDPRIADATDITRLRDSGDPRLTRVGNVAACVAKDTAPEVTATRITAADRIDSAFARAEGNATAGECPPEQQQQTQTRVDAARRAAAATPGQP